MKQLLILLLSLSLWACQSKKTFNINDFGAISDGTTLTTQALQQAIDAAFLNGGGRVLVPAGKYLCGTLLLKDNVELHLEENAEIIGSTLLKDYINIDPFTDAVGQQRGNCLIGAKGAMNIAITGNGIINGQGQYMQYGAGERSKRPFLVRIIQCKNVTLEGIQVQNSAAWTIHLFQSKDVAVHKVRILSQSEKNGDGIDIDSSEDVTITDCDINAHDDAICFKTTSPKPTRHCVVKNCLVSSAWGAIKLGTESMGNFEDIEVSHCYIYDNQGGGIKILSADGANIKAINIHNLEMNNVEMPIFIRLGSRLRTYRDAPKQAIGSIDGINISNIKIHGMRNKDWRINPPSTIFITGIPEAKIKHVTIKNIYAKMYCNGKAELANKEVPENETKYPEFTNFNGAIPAYGAYIRHAEQIHLSNITIETPNIEQRHLLKADDVKELVVNGWNAKVDKGAALPFAFVNMEKPELKNIQLTGHVPEQVQ